MPTCNILSLGIIQDTYEAQGWDKCSWKDPDITYEAFVTGLTETYNNHTPLKDRIFSDYITRLYNECFSANTDTWVSGGTLNSATGIATFTNTTGGTLDVSGFDGFTSYWSASTGGISTSGTGSVTAVGGFVGDVTGNVSGSAGIAAIGAVTNDSEEKMVFLSSSNAFRVVSSGFTFNPSTKLLTATGFIGNLTGNADTVTNGVYTSNNLSVMAATTSTQLRGVLSDETGTGSAVFATSPTLVTPALGTPASGVLTNTTGLPIATGLAVGTSANLAGRINDETGSGALVFGTSPTLVTPVLGTPTSGTLTNCTFPTLNQNTTGEASTVATIAGLAPNTAPTGTFLLPATAAAQGNITSVGTLTSLTVDNIVLNANAITTETNLDISGGDEGRVTMFETTTFGAGGVITGAESITSTAFVGTLTTASQPNITGVGTIGTGVWNGTDVGVAHGGTGVSTLGADAVLIGNGTGAITSSTNLTFDDTDLSLAGAGKMEFRGTGSYIHSTDTNDLEIVATDMEITATNIILDAATSIALEQDTTVTGTLTATRKYELPSSTVGTHSGGDIYYYGDGSTVKGSIYYINGTNWTLADADTVAASTTLLAVALGTDPDVDGMLLRGFVTLLTEVEGTEAIGSVLYLSATDTGIATITPPSGAGDIVRVIGYSLHATDNQVYFNPDGTWVQLT